MQSWTPKFTKEVNMFNRPGPQRTVPAPIDHPRTLYVVDLENIVGANEISERDARIARHRILTAVPALPGDQTSVGVSHHNAEAALFGWRGSARLLQRSGPDGADLALLESLEDVSWVARRFDRVVIASGDTAFAFAVKSLKAAGLAVTVVSNVGCLSSVLGRVAEGGAVLLPPLRPQPALTIIRNSPSYPSKDAA